MRTEAEQEPAFVPRLLAALAGFGARHPWLVLSFTAVTCALSLAYTAVFLTSETHRNDLIGKNRDYYRRWQQYVTEFGDDDDMVVVVQGPDRATIRTAVDDLASDIAKRPELFDRLFYRVDLRPLRSRALLFLPVEQIRQVQDQLQGMALLLDMPVLGGLDPLFGWKSLTLQQLMDEGRRKASAAADGPDPEPFFKQLAAICDGAADFLEDSSHYHSPWRSILPEQPGQDKQADQLAEPQYFFGGDGKLAFLLVRPVKEKDSFTYSQKSIDALREIVAASKERHPGLDMGLTGLPVLENDEMVASQNDSTLASWLALVGVAILYLVVYRGLRYPLMTVATLLVGTVWALGWLTLTVGHLNILSSAFAVMLIGMGDYGVLWVTRFDQERRGGARQSEATRSTALHVGAGILTAAVTTALAFYAAMLADLKAVAELGWIAGSGVILCALSCFVVMPALLALFDRKTPTDEAATDVLSLEEHRDARRHWLPGLMRRPWQVIGVCTLATCALGWFAVQIRYDHNLLNLQAQSFDSVKWERTLIEQTAGTSWHALSYTTTPEEALALKARYEQLPEVSRVVEVASLIPRDQDRKMEMLADIQRRLKPLPPRGAVIEHVVPSANALLSSSNRLADAVAKLPPQGEAARLQASVRRLGRVLDTQVAGKGKEDAAYRLKVFEELMTRDLAEDLHRLREVSTPAPIRIDDLPVCLRERFIGKNGKWLLRIFSKDCLWEFEPLSRFVRQVCTVDPEATGKPFTTLEGLRAMQSGFSWAGVYALIAMVIVLLFDFGSVKHTLVALLPLAMGLVVTLGLMQLFGVPLNPANMIAFPLILGVGADNGVHVLHDYRGRDRSRRYLLGHATGRGITVAALTTVLGFGTLMIAQHRGMASLGLALTIGVSCCMIAALVFLPALLGVVGERKRLAADGAQPERRAV